ncbi:hypothetical protein [Pedobacter sp. L105]|uniref:hypothetical protein n=1 Tax=Pedobacter sp. L105 TaxID=1641871 RepID=UPI00131C1561|nr:hypothetical protein [Pedobacter sp. L105]
MQKTRFSLLSLKNLDGLLISVIGFLLIIIYTRYNGIGVSPDSIAYLSAARNMYMHGLLADYNMRPLVDFPLFYPFFLSVIGFITRIDPLILAPVINGLLLAGIIVMTGYLIDTFEGTNKWYKRIILFFLALSPSLLDIYSMLWSETLFLFLTIAFIASFSRYLRKRTLGSLLFCAGVAAVACITRYAGVTLVGTGLLLLVFDRSLEWRKRMIYCIYFGFISISLLVANLVRNAVITSSLTGPRQKGILTLSDNVVFYGRVICSWLPVHGDQPRLVSGIAIAIFIFISLLFLKRSWLNRTYETAENCFAAFFIVYTVFIIGISTLSHFEQINNRFISPVFVPMLIGLTSWIPNKLRQLNRVQFGLAVAILGIIGIVFEYGQLKQVHFMYEDVKDYGIGGYTDDSWKHSETAKFLREHPDYFNRKYTVYSNDHQAAYFNGRMRTESIAQRVNKHDTDEMFEEDGFYLIWFDNFSDNELVKFRYMWDRSYMVKKFDFNDGDIFFVKPRHPLVRPR